MVGCCVIRTTTLLPLLKLPFGLGQRLKLLYLDDLPSSFWHFPCGTLEVRGPLTILEG